MEAQHKKRIQVNFVFIKDNISDVESVVDHLIERETFSLEQRSDIVKDSSSSRDTCQKLIDCLIKSGPAAYDNFLTALQQTNNCHLVERLNDSNVELPIKKKSRANGVERDNTQTNFGSKAEIHGDMEESSRSQHETTEHPDKINLTEINETIKRLEKNMIEMKAERIERDDRLSKAINTLHDEVKLYREKSLEIAEVNSKLIDKEERYNTLQAAFIKLKEQLEEGRQRLESRNQQNIQQAKQIEELEAELETMKKEMRCIEEEKTRVISDFKALEDTMQKQKAELEQLKLDTEKQLAEKEKRIHTLNNDKNDLNNKFSSLIEHTDQQRKTIEHLFSVIDELYKLKNKPVNYIPPFCAAGNSSSSKNINFNRNKYQSKFGMNNK